LKADFKGGELPRSFLFKHSVISGVEN